MVQKDQLTTSPEPHFFFSTAAPRASSPPLPLRLWTLPYSYYHPIPQPSNTTLVYCSRGRPSTASNRPLLLGILLAPLFRQVQWLKLLRPSSLRLRPLPPSPRPDLLALMRRPSTRLSPRPRKTTRHPWIDWYVDAVPKPVQHPQLFFFSVLSPLVLRHPTCLSKSRRICI